MKKCCKCKIEKSIEKFGLDGSNKDGYRYKCKECFNANARKFAKNNPEIIKARNLKQKEWRKEYYSSEKGIEVSRRAHLKRSFNLTLEQYNKLLEAQEGVCAICEKQEMNNVNKVLCVDHCHVTGEIRGLLCGTCNLGIGGLKDSIPLVIKSLKYLKKYE